MQSLNCHNWLLAVQDIQVFRGSSFEICGVNPRKCDCIAILRSIDKCMGPLVTRRTPEIERRSEIHFDAALNTMYTVYVFQSHNTKVVLKNNATIGPGAYRFSTEVQL